MRGLAPLVSPDGPSSSGIAPYRFDPVDPNTLSHHTDCDDMPALVCESEDEDINDYNSKLFAHAADSDDDTDSDAGSINGDFIRDGGRDESTPVQDPIILRPRPDVHDESDGSSDHHDCSSDGERGRDKDSHEEDDYSYGESSGEDPAVASPGEEDKPTVMHVFSEVLAGLSFPASLQVRYAKFVHYPSGGKFYGGLNDELAWRPVQEALGCEDVAAVLWTPPSSSYRYNGSESLPPLRGKGKHYFGNPGLSPEVSDILKEQDLLWLRTAEEATKLVGRVVPWAIA